MALEAVKGMKTLSELSSEYRVHSTVITQQDGVAYFKIGVEKAGKSTELRKRRDYGAGVPLPLRRERLGACPSLGEISMISG